MIEIGIDCNSNDRKRTTNWMHLLVVKKRHVLVNYGLLHLQTTGPYEGGEYFK